MKGRTGQFYSVMAVIISTVAFYQMFHITGPTMYPDEFGYFANAADWLGFDWSQTVSLQSYYSFGYSIMLLPFMYLIHNPLLMYKVAVLMNMIIIYLHAVLMYRIAVELREDNQEHTGLYCLMAACYPSLLFYMQMTMTESLLNLLFLFCIQNFVCFESRKRLKYVIVMIFGLVYLYFVHMRSVGILAAGALTGCWYLINTRQSLKKKIYFILGAAVLFFLLFISGSIIKDRLLESIYAETGKQLLDVNDYGGQIEKIKTLLTLEGLKDLIVSIVGKLYYIGLSTLGTFYFGVWFLWKKVWKHRKEKTEYVYIFILLSVIFTILISSLYTSSGGRGDLYIYGRYNELVIPICIYLGLYEMARNRKVFPIAAGIVTVQGVMAFLLVYAMKGVNPRGFQGYFTIGISYALKEIMPEIQNYVVYPYIVGTAATLLLTLVMGIFIRKKKKLVWYLTLFTALFVYTAISAGPKYLYDHSIDTGEDMYMVEQIKNRMQSDDTILFLDSETDALYVDILQFCLRERPLHIMKETDLVIEENDADFVITYRDGSREQELLKQYSSVMKTYHFKLYYDE